MVSGASRRLRALAALSGSLTDALYPKEAADLVEREALSALGATSAVVVTLGPFPPPIATDVGQYAPPARETLHVVHAIGLPAEVKAALEQLPINAAVPLAEVAREGQPLFLPSEAEMQRYPDWAERMIRAGARSAAVVPVWANGELRGVLGLSWGAPRIFDEDERAFVLTLGVMCAQAIMSTCSSDRSAGTSARFAIASGMRTNSAWHPSIVLPSFHPPIAVPPHCELWPSRQDAHCPHGVIAPAMTR